MCNHYKHPNKWRELPRDLQDKVMLPASNQADMWPGSYGPVVRSIDDALVAETMRWGFPTSRPGKRDLSKMITTYWTNARNLDVSLWRGWIGKAEHRCLVPVTAFAEPDPTKGKRGETWFGMADGEAPGFAFAGLWKPTSEGGHFCIPDLRTERHGGGGPPQSDARYSAAGGLRRLAIGDTGRQISNCLFR